MGFSYDIDPLLGLAYVQVDGEISFEDVMKSTIDLASRAGFDPGLRVLADARTCRYDPSWRELLAVAMHLGDFQTFFEEPIALVLRRRGIMPRLFARVARMRRFPLRVFSQIEDASAWLDSTDRG